MRKHLAGKMGKRIGAMMVAASLLLSMTGCGGTETPKETEKQTEKATEKATEKETETQKAEINRPDANTVTAYDMSASDFQMMIDVGKEMHDVSDLLYGIFIEDINFAADGGLYAEKVVNRSFEFTKLAKGDEMYGWETVGSVDAKVTVGDAAGGLNENNTNYMVMKNTSGAPAGIANVGFLDGLSVTENGAYRFSVYAKGLDGYKGPLYINLVVDNETVGNAKIDAVTSEWKKYELALTSKVDANKRARLQVLIDKGSAAVDMVSLFPEDTYKGRENGMRKDLAEMLEALSPSFLRFPGGCVIEGYDEATAYDWKDSIGVGSDGKPLLFNGGYGDVAARKQGTNIWTDIRAKDDPWPSFMTYGLGFFEYFQLAEDLGAIGVPVLNCGLYCQVRGGKPVQIGSEKFEQYIQDALDLVEFCRGDVNTTWGKVRASLGHEEPFELKYIGIGNENWGYDYYSRYEKFVEAFDKAAKEKPELFEGVEIMYSAGVDDGTSGPDYMPSYVNASKWLEAHPDADVLDYAGAIDHHYYNTPDWFLENTDYYDEENYSRDKESMATTKYGGAIPVFIGEYAAQSNTLKAALAEAAYMTGIERNSDIIRMAAYAPLFGNLTATHWSPDLIWFNNHVCTGSINYYMQKLFATNVGTKVLSSELNQEEDEVADLKGKIGVATWNTAATFDNIKITDNKTGEVLAEQDFEKDTFAKWTDMSGGNFKVKDGKLVQPSLNVYNDTTGTAAYFGDVSWTNYTYTLEATKTSGKEGFLIPFAVRDSKNQYFWNIGGWDNTVTCVQEVIDGSKGGQMEGTVVKFGVKTGQTYEIKIVVDGINVKGYIDGKLMLEFTEEPTPEVFQVVSTDETGDIIVKLVNTASASRVFAIDLGDAKVASKAEVSQVKGDKLSNDNILGKEEDCKIEELSVDGFGAKFNYTVPQYSATVIRLHRE